MGWRVDADEAYAAWVARHDPSLEEEAHLWGVLVGWQEKGPPNPYESEGENLICIGPHFERIVYRVHETGPGDEWEGIIHVLVIL